MAYTAEAYNEKGIFARLQTNKLEECHTLFRNLRHSEFTARIINNKSGNIIRQFNIIDKEYFLK